MKRREAGPGRAALYYRYSTDEQEGSLERQKSQVEPYARSRGYLIVAQEHDLGISGSEFEKRPGFMRLLAGAREGRFDVIVCDDQDRFSRFTPQMFCWVMQELEEAGVRVETVSGGVIDTANFANFLMAQVRQHQASAEAPKIAERVMKDWLSRARRGLDIGGHIPYGYRRDWTEDLERAQVARWLFEAYATRDTSLKALSNELHARGVVSPRGKGRWSPSTLRDLLVNRAYIGEYRRFEESKAKWAYLDGGTVKVAGRRRKRQPNPESEWVVIKDHHRALIDADLFARVQARLRGNQRHTAPRAGGTEHLLGRRLLACGHCGSWMTGTTWKVRGRAVKYYMCSGNNRFGETHCHPGYVTEEELLDRIVPALQESLLHPDFLEAMREEARRQHEADADPSAIEALERRLASLDADIASGNRNLAFLPPDRLDGVIALVRAWEQQRADVERELRRVRAASQEDGVEATVRRLEGILLNLREAVRRGLPDEVRGVLRELTEKIEVWVNVVPWGKKRRFKLDRGLIHIREDGTASSDSSGCRPGRG